jgi:hypothetical protein
MIDQILKLGGGIEKLLGVSFLVIIANLVSLILDSEVFELSFDLLLGNVSLLDFGIGLNTENCLDLVLFDYFSDLVNIDWSISDN